MTLHISFIAYSLYKALEGKQTLSGLTFDLQSLSAVDRLRNPNNCDSFIFWFIIETDEDDS